MSELLNDLAKRGAKILLDTKTPRQAKENPAAKKLPQPTQAPKDIHESFIRKSVADKPKKQVLLDFFQEVIEIEEKKL
jgi:hypothetical protein